MFRENSSKNNFEFSKDKRKFDSCSRIPPIWTQDRRFHWKGKLEFLHFIKSLKLKTTLENYTSNCKCSRKMQKAIISRW